MPDFREHPLIPFLQEVPGGVKKKKILDIGAGPYQPMTSAVAEVLDSAKRASQNTISVDKDFTHRWFLPFSPVAGAEAQHLPFADSSFDVISLISVLHILQKEQGMEKGLSEISRVLVPGGIGLIGFATLEPRIATPNKSRLNTVDTLKLFLNIKKINAHMDQYRQAVIDAGFDVQKEWKEYNWGAVLANFIVVNAGKLEE